MKQTLLATVSVTFVTSITVISALSVQAASVTLYNGSGLPGAQGWLAPNALTSSGTLTTVTQATATGGGVQVNTDPASTGAEYSGYSNYRPNLSPPPVIVLVNSSFPTLDRVAGYTIAFNVSLDSTTSNSNDRAAFSVTAISSDGNLGIELGFESGLIFAQSANFTRAENAAITTSASTNYSLAVLGNSYTLAANGSDILSGALRSYNFNPLTSSPPLPFNAYRTPNFLFFGDNTGQEFGTFTLGSASVTTGTVPYGFSPVLGLVILGGAVIWHRAKAKG